MAQKIALVIAHKGYQSEEYTIPKKIFEQEGFTVVTVSDKAGTASAGNDKTTAKVDVTLDTFDPLQYDALVFIGGQGALDYLDNDLSYRVIQKAVMADKVVGGICSAARILAKAGALVAKAATGWDGDHKLKDVFDQHAVIYDDESGVVTDGHIVTATGPKHAERFARELLAVM